MSVTPDQHNGWSVIGKVQNLSSEHLGVGYLQGGQWESLGRAQDASAIFPIQKIPFRWNKDFMTIYHRVQDLSHSSKCFVGELWCYKNVKTLDLTNSPTKYLLLWPKSCTRWYIVIKSLFQQQGILCIGKIAEASCEGLEISY
jgi:hypothetical protein